MVLDLRLAIEPSVFGDSPIKLSCLNPAHDDPNASMAVYTDHIHCFGCGFHRNDWDEALSLLLGITVVEAGEVAENYDGGNQRTANPRGSQELHPLPVGRADLYHHFMRSRHPNKERWFLNRGLTSDTIRQERLGYDGFRYTIPVYDNAGNLVAIRYRADYTRLPDKLIAGINPEGDVVEKHIPKYCGITGRNGMYLYGAHWLEPDSKYAIICEGELDALLLHQLGHQAFSATNGAGQSRLLPGLAQQQMPSLHTIYIATDQDRGDGRQTRKGEEAAMEVAKAATGLGLSVYRLSWLIGKDVTEHYTRNGNKLDFIKGVWNGTKFTY